jgi:hypothetical protein
MALISGVIEDNQQIKNKHREDNQQIKNKHREDIQRIKTNIAETSNKR